MIGLARGDWLLMLRPELGAAVTRLTWRGHDILRPTRDGAAHPLETGSFPLVPYANRIDRGAFVFGGRDVVLASYLRDTDRAMVLDSAGLYARPEAASDAFNAQDFLLKHYSESPND